VTNSSTSLNLRGHLDSTSDRSANLVAEKLQVLTSKQSARARRAARDGKQYRPGVRGRPRKWSDDSAALRSLFSTLHAHVKASCSGKRRGGRSCSLTFDQFKALRAQSCYACGGDLPRFGIGLRRLDVKRGYHLDNVMPACSRCINQRARGAA